jgi:hypothetical protein
MIKKFPGQQKYGLYSLSSGKRLGVFRTKQAAINREKQIQFFKNKGK